MGAEQRPSKDLDRAKLLAETMIDGASPVDPPPSPPPGQHAALDDTAEDLKLVGDTPPAKIRSDLDLDAVFDRPQTPIAQHATLRRDDPEFGKGSVAIKPPTVKAQVQQAVGSPFGRLITAAAAALVGVAVGIMAGIQQTWPLIIAAAVITPATLWWLSRRYQAWLGHRRYMYRLLEQLGEDVEGLSANRSPARPRQDRPAPGR